MFSPSASFLLECSKHLGSKPCATHLLATFERSVVLLPANVPQIRIERLVLRLLSEGCLVLYTFGGVVFTFVDHSLYGCEAVPSCLFGSGDRFVDEITFAVVNAKRASFSGVVLGLALSSTKITFDFAVQFIDGIREFKSCHCWTHLCPPFKGRRFFVSWWVMKV